MKLSTLGLLIALTPARAGDPVGFRQGGDGVAPEGPMPVGGVDAAEWTARLPGAGHASPVTDGVRVCTTTEPDGVVCVDARTGEVLWTARNDYVDTLPEAARPAMRSQLALRAELEAARDEARRAVGLARRAARAGSPGADAGVAQAEAALAEVSARLAALDPFLPVGDRDGIGWAAHTPLLLPDGALIAQHGHGVVTAFESDGTKRWSVWLGPARVPMAGYELGSATSPLWVAGLVIVGHRHLVALDPDTGAVRWRGPEWPHFGTPARLPGDRPRLLLPDGRVVDARDGRVDARPLPAVWFVAPVVSGAHALVIGGTIPDAEARRSEASVWAVDGWTALARQRWGDLDPDERFYTPPVVTGDGAAAAVVTRPGRVRIVTLPGLKLVADVDLRGLRHEEVYASPVRVGGSVVVVHEGGRAAAVSLTAPWAVTDLGHWGRSRATPAWTEDAVFVRHGDALSRLRRGAPPEAASP